MSDRESDVNMCHICYDDLEFSSYVRFNKTNQETCTSCANEIVLANYPLSPFDGIECERIVYFKIRPQEQMSLSVDDYRFLMVRDENMMRNLIERTWCSSLQMSIEVLNQFSILKKNMKEIMENSTPEQLVTVSTEKLKRLNSQFQTALRRFSEDFDIKEVKCKLIDNAIMKDYCPDKMTDVRETKELNFLLSDMTSLFHRHLQAQMLFNPMAFEPLTESTFNSTQKQVQNDIDSLDMISQYFRALVISEVEDNKELYALVSNTETPFDEQKCLICCSPVDVTEFAKFQECRHKICLKCVKTFEIRQARCPFEKCATHLMVYKNCVIQETILNYLLSKEVQQELQSVLKDTVITIVTHWNRLKPIIETIQSLQHQPSLHTKDEIRKILKDWTDCPLLGWLEEGHVYPCDWEIYFLQKRIMMNRSDDEEHRMMVNLLHLVLYTQNCVNMFYIRMYSLLKVVNPDSIEMSFSGFASFRKRKDLTSNYYESLINKLKTSLTSKSSTLATPVQYAEDVYFVWGA